MKGRKIHRNAYEALRAERETCLSPQEIRDLYGVSPKHLERVNYEGRGRLPLPPGKRDWIR